MGATPGWQDMIHSDIYLNLSWAWLMCNWVLVTITAFHFSFNSKKAPTILILFPGVDSLDGSLQSHLHIYLHSQLFTKWNFISWHGYCLHRSVADGWGRGRHHLPLGSSRTAVGRNGPPASLSEHTVRRPWLWVTFHFLLIFHPEILSFPCCFGLFSREQGYSLYSHVKGCKFFFQV